MLDAERFELIIGGRTAIAPPLSDQDFESRDLPAVPVLAETLLRMELEVRESATDLRKFSEAVLADVGATIQILRLAGQEYGGAIDGSVRVEDCILDLGPRACLNAAAHSSMIGGMRLHPNPGFWTHAREVAQCSKLFAGHGAAGISPDQAYLAGLLHALGALPAVLGWNRFGLPSDPARVALAIAEQWRLPRFVVDFFGEVHEPGHCPEWREFISFAHHLAKASWLDCPLVSAPPLSILSAVGAGRRSRNA